MSTHPSHITRVIAELGEKQAVVTTRAIFNKRGVKVVEKGVSVTAHLYDRLMAHTLDRPLEDSVSSQHTVTSQSLRASAETALEEVALFRRICTDGKMRHLLLDAIGSVPLPQAMAFQLTLASEVRPGLFRHLVRTSLFATWMAHDASASRFDLTVAAAAGLLHDIGMLHLDPILLAPQGALNTEQRRQLYVHPKVSSALIERHHEYPRVILRAVMEHHEFLDGSGYPQHLSQQAISPLARILSLGELFAAMNSPERNASEHRLWVLLRMNQHRYDPRLVERLLNALEPARSSAGEPVLRLPNPVGFLRDICLTLADWPAHLPASATISDALLDGFSAVNAQAEQLQRTLANVGATAVQLDQLGHEELDEQLRGELTLFAQEAAWQLRSLARHARRRWWQSAESGYPQALANWLQKVDDIVANDQLWAGERDRLAAL
jgi:HD-GYP domain-containing protein (c-di-GMP phosphodiesterase class II)